MTAIAAWVQQRGAWGFAVYVATLAAALLALQQLLFAAQWWADCAGFL